MSRTVYLPGHRKIVYDGDDHMRVYEMDGSSEVFDLRPGVEPRTTELPREVRDIVYDRNGMQVIDRDEDKAQTDHITGAVLVTIALIISLIALIIVIVIWTNSMPVAAPAATFPHTVAMAYNFTGVCGATFIVNGSYFKTGNQVCHNIPRFTCDCNTTAQASPFGPIAAPIPASLAPKRVTSHMVDVATTFGMPSVAIDLFQGGEGNVFSPALIFVNQTTTAQYIVIGILLNSESGAEEPVFCDTGIFFGPAHGYQLCYEAVAVTAGARRTSHGPMLLLAGAVVAMTAGM
jgi:hypothetical protein